MEGIYFEHWLFMFFIFTFIGWIHETTVESLYHRKFVNRGSLKGPYIPVYGFGGCVIILLGEPFKSNGFFVFLAGMIGCTVLEYFTGFLMEKLFKRQFWDYSMMKLVYKNRISLLSSLCWGLLSLFMIYILFPLLKWFGYRVGSTFMTFFDCAMKLSPEQIKAAFAEKRMRIGRIFGHFSAAIHRRKSEIDNEIETDQSAENRS